MQFREYSLILGDDGLEPQRGGSNENFLTCGEGQDNHLKCVWGESDIFSLSEHRDQSSSQCDMYEGHYQIITVERETTLKLKHSTEYDNFQPFLL